MISASQAGVLAGGQFIVHQASPSKVVGQQQILTTAGKRPYKTKMLKTICICGQVPQVPGAIFLVQKQLILAGK